MEGLPQLSVYADYNASYPKAVFFILAFAFSERFCNLGIEAIKILYLENQLKFTVPDAVSISHGFVAFGAIFPIVGALLADSWFGRYRTIIGGATVYCLGGVLLTVATILTSLEIRKITFIIGILILGIGDGTIASCTMIFGGEQFLIPQQQKEFIKYFSYSFIIGKVSAVTTTFLTPVLRSLSCLGQDSCYPLAVGVPTAVLILATILFVSATRTYKIVKPSRNVLLEVIKCMYEAAKIKLLVKDNAREDHWLDNAKPKFDPQLIEDTKYVLSFFLLVLPMPVYWSLFMQTSTTWIDQANSMDGSVGSTSLLPEHMLDFNPFVTLVLTPLFTFYVYPIWESRQFLATPLQKMATGMFCICISFLIAALVQWKIDESYPTKIHMLWQVPQIFILAVGEILFNLTLNSFGFTQAPKSMRSVIQASWILSITFGNLIVSIISAIDFLPQPIYQFIFYAGLMFLDLLLFIYLAKKYVYKTFSD